MISVSRAQELKNLVMVIIEEGNDSWSVMNVVKDAIKIAQGMIEEVEEG
jgi:hypothetical protein